jgi:hypothetical protein
LHRLRDGGQAEGEAEAMLDLLERLLTLDPSKRLPSGDAVRHPYFRSGVLLPRGQKGWYGAGKGKVGLDIPVFGEVRGVGFAHLMGYWLDSARRHWDAL